MNQVLLISSIILPFLCHFLISFLHSLTWVLICINSSSHGVKAIRVLKGYLISLSPSFYLFFLLSNQPWFKTRSIDLHSSLLLFNKSRFVFFISSFCIYFFTSTHHDNISNICENSRTRKCWILSSHILQIMLTLSNWRSCKAQ